MTRTQTRQPMIGTAHGVRLAPGRTLESPPEGPIRAIPVDGDDLWARVARRDVHRVSGGTSTIVARLDEAAGTVVGTHRGDVWVGGHGARLWRLHGTTL